MATELLYHQDPLLLSFEASVVSHGNFNGRPSVVLNRTAFYPESGGQMADRGVLAGAAVADVQVDDSGVVHHFVEGVLPELGAAVRGEIDRARRRSFMALHTAQHMFSRALIEVARAETVSARLGEQTCTIDLSVPSLAERDLARAQDLANTIVDDDLEVFAWFPAPAELESLPLRRKPKVEENIRIVRVGEFDYSPCGGTHCISTAQVGLISTLGLERYKGMMRVTFDAGPRARELLASESRLLRALASGFSCGPLDVAAAVERLRGDLSAAQKNIRRLGERAAGEIARELAAAAAGGRVVAIVEGADRDLLRAVAGRLCGSGSLVAMLAAEEGGELAVICARGPESTFDCGAWMKQLASRGGKGGGRADRAEGKVARAAWPA